MTVIRADESYADLHIDSPASWWLDRGGNVPTYSCPWPPREEDFWLGHEPMQPFIRIGNEMMMYIAVEDE